MSYRQLLHLSTIYFFLSSFTLLSAQDNTINISANSLKMNLSPQILKLSDTVIVTFQGISITTNLAQYEQDSNVLKMGPSVTIRDQTLTFTCNHAIINHATGDILGTGNIKLSFPPYTGFSENIHYIKKKNVIILTGNPNFITETQRLRATKLILNTKTKQIQSQGATNYSSLKKQ